MELTDPELDIRYGMSNQIEQLRTTMGPDPGRREQQLKELLAVYFEAGSEQFLAAAEELAHAPRRAPEPVLEEEPPAMQEAPVSAPDAPREPALSEVEDFPPAPVMRPVEQEPEELVDDVFGQTSVYASPPLETPVVPVAEPVWLEEALEPEPLSLDSIMVSDSVEPQTLAREDFAALWKQSPPREPVELEAVAEPVPPVDVLDVDLKDEDLLPELMPTAARASVEPESLEIDLQYEDEPVTPKEDEERSLELQVDMRALDQEQTPPPAPAPRPVAAQPPASLPPREPDIGKSWQLHERRASGSEPYISSLPEIPSYTPRVLGTERSLPDDVPTVSALGTKLDLVRAYREMGDTAGARELLKEIIREGSPAQQQEARKLLATLPGEEQEPATANSVGTKLDLAHAYAEMGDPDGARSLLEEVLKEGSAAEQREARRLLATLPGPSGIPARSAASKLMLIRTDSDTGIAYMLGARTRIGRSADNDVQVDASAVARHHAQILAGSTQIIIEDLDSTTGVWINGERIRRWPLKDGDMVTIGNAQFRFVVRAAPQ